MHGSFRYYLGLSLIAAAGCLLLSAPVKAQDHVVSSADLSRAVASAAGSRHQQVKQIEQFLSSDTARKALNRVHLDPAQVQRAVPFLSDAELARLSARSAKAQSDFAAGALTNEQLTYIIIALATAVIVIIIVER